MATIHRKPTSPGQRHAVAGGFEDVTERRPHKALTKFRKKSVGRSFGQITSRHKGSGHKRRYRDLDFRQERFDVEARVQHIAFDPNRTARIALIAYKTGQKSYVLAPEGLHIGDKLISSQKKIEAKPGYRMPLKFVPDSSFIHNIELYPGRGGQMVKSAGSVATVQAHEGSDVQVKLASGEVRVFSENCMASIGQLSNQQHMNTKLGKAGRNRWKGVRPTVRGSAMNPVDHPHGGGEGKSPIGLKHPKTPWGKVAMGHKTRRKGKQSDNVIVKRRK